MDVGAVLGLTGEELDKFRENFGERGWFGAGGDGHNYRGDEFRPGGGGIRGGRNDGMPGSGGGGGGGRHEAGGVGDGGSGIVIVIRQ